MKTLDNSTSTVTVTAELLATIVVSEDYSQFESGNSSNGGSYGFWVEREYYMVNDDVVWIDIHKTTSDFDYSELEGCFSSLNWCVMVRNGAIITVDGNELYTSSAYLADDERVEVQS